MRESQHAHILTNAGTHDRTCTLTHAHTHTHVGGLCAVGWQRNCGGAHSQRRAGGEQLFAPGPHHLHLRSHGCASLRRIRRNLFWQAFTGTREFAPHPPTPLSSPSQEPLSLSPSLFLSPSPSFSSLTSLLCVWSYSCVYAISPHAAHESWLGPLSAKHFG